MAVIKLDKKTNTKIDQLMLVISILCLLNDIKLSKTDIKVLSYFIVYKISDKTDKLLINSKIVRDATRLRNIKVKLKNKGFLKRVKDLYRSYEVALSKDFNVDDNDIRLMIKIDNS